MESRAVGAPWTRANDTSGHSTKRIGTLPTASRYYSGTGETRRTRVDGVPAAPAFGARLTELRNAGYTGSSASRGERRSRTLYQLRTGGMTDRKRGWPGVIRPRPGCVVVVAVAGCLLISGAAPSPAFSAAEPPLVHTRHVAAQQADGPTAVIVDPGDLTVGSPVTFDGGSAAGDIVAYSWDFGDGSPPTGGKVATHVYRTVDDYTITLSVQDRAGRSDRTTRTVRVIPALTELDGRPALGQITPASSFTALLALNAAGPATVSVKIGGTYLYSDRWDYQGGNAP